jgi:uncharacterized protein (DUF362 family)
MRRLFAAWGRDPEDPFHGWVEPGGRVTIKPNWVRDFNPDGHDIESLVTHGSLVAAAVGYAARALRGRGRIVVGDAPLQDCDFAALRAKIGIDAALDEVRRRNPGLEVVVEDWRLTRLSRPAGHGGSVWSSGQTVEDDSALADYVIVDRGADSFLCDLEDYAERFRVTCYDHRLMAPHHGHGRHEYLVRRSALECDLFVNLPKWKTHSKAGVTGAMKNLVGINGHKEFLPHHVKGGFFRGGDEYFRGNAARRVYDELYERVWERFRGMSPLRRRASGTALGLAWAAARLTGSDRVQAGNWAGNETTWRTTLDLNHVLLSGGPRKVVAIVDGIVAGEGEGPLRPRPRPAGLLVGGENPAYVDATLARLTGYSLARVPTVFHALHDRRSLLAGPPPEAAQVTWIEPDATRVIRLADLPDLAFRLPDHWERARR